MKGEKMSFIKKIYEPDVRARKLIQSKKNSEEIAWVFPDAIENWEKDLNLSSINHILVKNIESAVIYNYEQYIESITNGIYKIDRKQGLEGIKIVFLTASVFDIKWGIPQQQGSLTSENIKIGSISYGKDKRHIVELVW